MDIQFLVEKLEQMVMSARKMPLTTQVILEQAAVLDLIDQIRVSIPEEVRRARRVDQESERILARARDEAEQIIGAAQEQAALLLQDQAILRRAEAEAEEIASAAREKAADTMRGADQYASDVLVRLESDLDKTLSIVRKSLEVLEERRAEPIER